MGNVSRRWLTASILLFASSVLPASQRPRLMTAGDLAAFESPEPDRRIAYGGDPLQFGELRNPEGPGPHPIAIVFPLRLCVSASLR